MTVFQNKNLVKAFLEKKKQEDKIEESLGLGKKSYSAETDIKTWSWILVADTETRFQLYTTRPALYMFCPLVIIFFTPL